MSAKKYFDLTVIDNQIEHLEIKPENDFNCKLVDEKSGEIYTGFKLAQSKEGNVYTVCDVDFKARPPDWKYKNRLIFRKTNKNFETKSNRQPNECETIIAFQSGQNGYRNFWQMVNFLYKNIPCHPRSSVPTPKTPPHLENKGNLDARSTQITDFFSKLDDKTIHSLKNLPDDKLKNIDYLVNAVKLEKIIKLWKEYKNESDERAWQKIFESHKWILPQVFSCPCIFLKGNFFCGGTEDSGSGGIEGDILLENALTKNLLFIEIKTPKTELVGSKYRGNENQENSIYAASKEITGGVNQVLNQKKVYITQHGNKHNKGDFLYNVKCALILGTIESLSADQKKSFELYRSSLRDVEIITYDELFKKLEFLLEVFKA